MLNAGKIPTPGRPVARRDGQAGAIATPQRKRGSFSRRPCPSS